MLQAAAGVSLGRQARPQVYRNADDFSACASCCLHRNVADPREHEIFHASVTILRSVNSVQQARRYFVSGGVQGVGFRYFTQHAAAKLCISGYVRNLRDGRVEAFACGTPEQLAQFRAQLECGPRFASVREVLEQEAALDERFSIGFAIAHED